MIADGSMLLFTALTAVDIPSSTSSMKMVAAAKMKGTESRLAAGRVFGSRVSAAAFPQTVDYTEDELEAVVDAPVSPTAGSSAPKMGAWGKAPAAIFEPPVVVPAPVEVPKKPPTGPSHVVTPPAAQIDTRAKPSRTVDADGWKTVPGTFPGQQESAASKPSDVLNGNRWKAFAFCDDGREVPEIGRAHV